MIYDLNFFIWAGRSCCCRHCRRQCCLLAPRCVNATTLGQGQLAARALCIVGLQCAGAAHATLCSHTEARARSQPNSQTLACQRNTPILSEKAICPITLSDNKSPFPPTPWDLKPIPGLPAAHPPGLIKQSPLSPQPGTQRAHPLLNPISLVSKCFVFYLMRK